jgi:hypothetical protein
MSSERLSREPCPTALQHRADRERSDDECDVTGNTHNSVDDTNSEQRSDLAVAVDEHAIDEAEAEAEPDSDGTQVIEWDIARADTINSASIDPLPQSCAPPPNVINGELTSPRRSTRAKSFPNAIVDEQRQILAQIQRNNGLRIHSGEHRSASTPVTPRSGRQSQVASPRTPSRLTSSRPRPSRYKKRTPARVHSITAVLEAEPSPSSFIQISHSFTEQELPKLYNAARVMQMIPQACIPQWIKTVRAHLTAYKQARTSGDEQQITDALWALTTVAIRTLRPVRRGSGRKNAIQWVHKRLTAAEKAIESAEYFGSESQLCSEVRTARRNSAHEQRKLDSACIEEAVRQVSMGYLGQAKRALKQSLSVAPAHKEATYNQLLRLHPQSIQELPLLPDNASDHLLGKHDMDVFIRHIHKIDNGSTPGPSQWSGHMLRVLTADPTCMESLMDLMNDIINGKIPAAARSFLMSSRLIAIYKDAEQESVRPIAIGEIFYRLASRIVSHEAIPRAKTILRNQYGVGHKDGTAQVVHQLQTRISDVANPKAAITIDIRNAFNECSRAHVMKTVYRHGELDCLWKMVDFVYSSSTTLWTVDTDGQMQSSPALQSAQGVRQGDPLSPLLFSLVWQTVINEVLQDCAQQGILVDILSYLDDTTIVGSVDMVFGVYDMIVVKARNIGLHIQPAKSAFIYLHSATAPPNAATVVRIDENIIPSDEVITILGAPIGAVADKYRSVLQQRVDRVKIVFDRLSHKELPRQMANILLCKCVQMQFDYLLRMIPPNISETYAKQFDALVREAAVNAMDIDDVASSDTPQHELAMKQLYMPIDVGGNGLQRADDRRYIAFLAAHIGALVESPVQWATISDEHRQSYSDMLEIITECIDNIRAQFVASPTGELDEENAIRSKHIEELDRLLIPWAPDDANTTIKLSSLLQFYGGDERSTAGKYHLQTSLTRLAQLSYCHAFRHSSSPLISQLSDKFRKGYNAHMASLKTIHTGRWLSVIPRVRRNEMPDSEFVVAARARLYVQARKVPLEYCSCQPFRTGVVGHYVDDPLHALSCKLTRGRQITWRHDMVVDATATGLRQCGARVRVEQTSEDQNSKQRPDIFTTISGQQMFIDVGIVQPSAMSHRHKGPLVRTQEYEKEKSIKYKPVAMNHDAGMIPNIYECNGGYGEQACNLLEDIKRFAHEEALAFAPSEVVRDMMDAVAIAIQRGNAKAIIAAYERMMHIQYERQVVSTAQMDQSMVSIYEESEDGHDETYQSSMSQSATAAALQVACCA